MQILKTDGSLIIALPQFNNIKDAVEHCAKEKINLEGADLYGADLQGADLRGADLWGATTQYNARFGHFSKVGGRACFYYKPIETDATWVIVAGCFVGTLNEFEAAAKLKYPNDAIRAYEAQIAYLRGILI